MADFLPYAEQTSYRSFVLMRILRRALVVIALIAAPILLYLYWEVVAGFVLDNVYWVLAFAIGAVVGVGELLDRYRDAFHRVLLPPPALTYVVINGVASCAALGIMVALGLTIEGTAPDGTAIVTFPDVLIAGFGAIAFFRSSFFTTTIGNQSVGIGPNAVLQTLLSATDRQVDRHRANERFFRISRIMYAVSYESIVSNLLPFAFSAREHLELSTEDREKVTREVGEVINDHALNEDAKKIMIALTVEKLVGIEVLQTMVRSIVEAEQRARDEERRAAYEEEWARQRSDLLGREGTTSQPSPTVDEEEKEDPTSQQILQEGEVASQPSPQKDGATSQPSQGQEPGEPSRS